MKKEQIEGAVKGALSWTKRVAKKAQVMANEQIDNHRVRSIDKRLESLEASYKNLKQDELPALPDLNSVTPENAKEILKTLKSDPDICKAEKKGIQLNANIKECEHLFSSNTDQIAILPDDKKPVMPEYHLVSSETIKTFQAAIHLGKTLISIERECEAIKKSNLLDANLTRFFKAYGIDGDKFACGQYQTPNIILGTAASLSSQRSGNGALAVVGAIGTMVDSYNKGSIGGHMVNMRLYLNSATLDDKYYLIMLQALRLQNTISEQEFVSLYYGYYFDEGRSYLTFEKDFKKYLGDIKRKKKLGKAAALSINCSAYLLEKYAVVNRAKVIEFCSAHKTKVEPLVIELINKQLEKETASNKITKMLT